MRHQCSIGVEVVSDSLIRRCFAYRFEGSLAVTRTVRLLGRAEQISCEVRGGAMCLCGGWRCIGL